MAALDQYSWCGHAEVLGKLPGCGLATDRLLPLFGEKTTAAWQVYHQFLNAARPVEQCRSGAQRVLLLCGAAVAQSRSGGGAASRNRPIFRVAVHTQW